MLTPSPEVGVALVALLAEEGAFGEFEGDPLRSPAPHPMRHLPPRVDVVELIRRTQALLTAPSEDLLRLQSPAEQPPSLVAA